MMFQFKLKSFYNRGESYKSLGKEKKRRKTDKYRTFENKNENESFRKFIRTFERLFN